MAYQKRPEGIREHVKPCAPQDPSNKKTHPSSALKSHKIRKAPVPLPLVQYRRPVIIHTDSPKIIQADPASFMWLVQSLTGSSDTRSRCRRNKPLQRAVDKEGCNINKSDSQGLSELQILKPAVDTSSAPRRFHEQDSITFHNFISESHGLILQDEFALSCASTSISTSSGGSQFESFRQHGFPEVCPFPYRTTTQPHSSSSESLSLLSTLNPSNLEFAAFNNDSLLGTAWNQNPFESSYCIQSVSSPRIYSDEEWWSSFAAAVCHMAGPPALL